MSGQNAGKKICKQALGRWKYVVGREPQDFKMTGFDINDDDKFEFTTKVFNFNKNPTR